MHRSTSQTDPPPRTERAQAADALASALEGLGLPLETAGRGPLELPFPGFYCDVATEFALGPEDVRRAAAVLEAGGAGPARPPGPVALLHEVRDARPEGGGAPRVRVLGLLGHDRRELALELARLERAAERDHRWVGRDLGLFATEGMPPGELVWLPPGCTLRRLLRQEIDAALATAGYAEVSVPRPAPPPELAAAWRAKPRGRTDLPLRLRAVWTELRDGVRLRSEGLRDVRRPRRDAVFAGGPPRGLREELRRLVALVADLWSGACVPLEAIWDPGPDAQLAAALDPPAALVAAGVPARQEATGAPAAGPRILFRSPNTTGRPEHAAGWIEAFPPDHEPALAYRTPGGTRRAAALAGSVTGDLERLVAGLLEATGGDLPPRLAPVQVRVISLARDRAVDVQRLHEELTGAGLRSECDLRSTKVLAKLRDAAHARVPWTLVLGSREVEAGTVTLRRRERFDAPEERPRAELVGTLLSELAPSG